MYLYVVNESFNNLGSLFYMQYRLFLMESS